MAEALKVLLIGDGKWGNNYRRLLDKKGVDFNAKPVGRYWEKEVEAGTNAVIIACASAFHYLITLKAVEWGWHALVEKPITQSLAEAKHVARVHEGKGTILQAAHNLAQAESFKAMQRLVQAGWVGDIQSASFEFRQGTVRDEPGWVDIFPHYAYLSALVMGRLPETVSATSLIPHFARAVSNYGEVRVHAVVDSLARKRERQFEVRGTEGVMTYKWGSVDSLTFTPNKGEEQTLTPLGLTSLESQVNNYFDSILGRDEPLTPYATQGVAVMGMMQAFGESISANGAMVELDSSLRLT